MTIESILLSIAVVTVMPTLAYFIGDAWNIIKRDFGFSHWFENKKKGDLLQSSIFFAKVAISFVEKEEMKMLNTLIIFGLWAYALCYLSETTECQ